MKKAILAGIFSGVLCLGGCGGGGMPESVEHETENSAYEEAESGTLEAEIKMNEMDCLFPNAEGAWVGDVMAQADENEIQFNYLYETDYNAVGYHPIHRFMTTDFCSYTDVGEILPFGTELEDPDLAVGTGSFFKDREGTYHCYYTGHNDKAAELGIDKECIMHAVSEDNRTWTKVKEDTFYAPEGYSTDDFRDPFVFWNEQDGLYWMLIGAREDAKEGGCIIKYTSDDLKTWDFEGKFYEEEQLYFLECPDIFSINDWYYMVFSWNNVTYYRMAKSLSGPWETPEHDTFDGNAFYAAKTVEYHGVRYLIGFIDRKKGGDDTLPYTWAGSLCPYELVQKEDGTLGVKMPHQYGEQYFVNQTDAFDGTEKINETKIVGDLPQSMLLSCNVTFRDAGGKAGFLFGTEDGGEGYSVLLDQKEGCITYDAYPNRQDFPFEVGKTYAVNVVVENEIVIVYVDETKVLSNRIYAACGRKWGFTVTDGTVEFSDIMIKIK